MKPVLLVVAGPNGAGKTTVTARLREDHWSEGVEYLNPDEIARDRFGDWNSPEAVLSAARWAEARREELLAAGSAMAFETVLPTSAKIAIPASTPHAALHSHAGCTAPEGLLRIAGLGRRCGAGTR